MTHPDSATTGSAPAAAPVWLVRAGSQGEDEAVALGERSGDHRLHRHSHRQLRAHPRRSLAAQPGRIPRPSRPLTEEGPLRPFRSPELPPATLSCFTRPTRSSSRRTCTSSTRWTSSPSSPSVTVAPHETPGRNDTYSPQITLDRRSDFGSRSLVPRLPLLSFRTC